MIIDTSNRRVYSVTCIMKKENMDIQDEMYKDALVLVTDIRNELTLEESIQAVYAKLQAYSNQGMHNGFLRFSSVDEKTSDIPEMTASEQWEVRRYIAINHEDGLCHIYGDDGELFCGNTVRHGRSLDFRREPIQDLLNAIWATRMKEISNSLYKEGKVNEYRKY